jgi:hypothetical protein
MAGRRRALANRVRVRGVAAIAWMAKGTSRVGGGGRTPLRMLGVSRGTWMATTSHRSRGDNSKTTNPTTTSTTARPTLGR